jgi:hypothetical protein
MSATQGYKNLYIYIYIILAKGKINLKRDLKNEF